MLDFFLDYIEQLLQFCIMLRRDIGNHQTEQFEIFRILFQLAPPRNIIHISKVNFNLFSDREIIRVLVIIIKIFTVCDFRQVKDEIARLVAINRFYGAVNQGLHTVNG